MLIIELKYIKSIEEVDQHLVPHREFLKQCYAQKLLLASGPQIPRTGGFLIANTDRATMEDVLKQDPFYAHGIAEYKITEFEPVLMCDELKAIVKTD